MGTCKWQSIMDAAQYCVVQGLVHCIPHVHGPLAAKLPAHTPQKLNISQAVAYVLLEVRKLLGLMHYLLLK